MEKFCVLTSKDAEYIVEVIYEVFGNKTMTLSEDGKTLVLADQIFFAECPETKLIKIGMIEENGEKQLRFVMYDEDYGTTRVINGIEL